MEDYGLTIGSLGNPQALESTAARLLRESGASPVQFALPASFSAPRAPLAPNPQGQAAVASVQNLAAEALRRSEEDWKKISPS